MYKIKLYILSIFVLILFNIPANADEGGYKYNIRCYNGGVEILNVYARSYNIRVNVNIIAINGESNGRSYKVINNCIIENLEKGNDYDQ